MSTVTETKTKPQTLMPQEAETKRRAGELVIIDVRTGVEYASIHATDVIHIPLDTLNPQSLIEQYQGKTIACICKGGSRGAKAAQALLDAGHPLVANIAGGTQEWEASGLPVEKRPGVMPLERQVQLGAGLVILTGALLGSLVNPWFFAICAFVGLGLTFAGITGFCGLGLLLAKMPWNQRLTNKSCCGGSTCAS